MKIALFIILACITTGVSARVVDPDGGARGYYPQDQRAPQYFEPDTGRRVWRP